MSTNVNWERIFVTETRLARITLVCTSALVWMVIREMDSTVEVIKFFMTCNQLRYTSLPCEQIVLVEDEAMRKREERGYRLFGCLLVCFLGSETKLRPVFNLVLLPSPPRIPGSRLASPLYFTPYFFAGGHLSEQSKGKTSPVGKRCLTLKHNKQGPG